MEITLGFAPRTFLVRGECTLCFATICNYATFILCCGPLVLLDIINFIILFFLVFYTCNIFLSLLLLLPYFLQKNFYAQHFFFLSLLFSPIRPEKNERDGEADVNRKRVLWITNQIRCYIANCIVYISFLSFTELGYGGTQILVGKKKKTSLLNKK